MFNKVLQLLSIRCGHRNTSKPFTAASPAKAVGTDWEPVSKATRSHYVVCLDCGKKLPYDWNQMRIVK